MLIGLFAIDAEFLNPTLMAPNNMNFIFFSGGQFAPARGDQFGPARPGQIKPARGGQLIRRLQ
jgi:hypothetical protein